MEVHLFDKRKDVFMKKVFSCMVALMFLILCLTGCGGYKFNADTTSLYIRQDGTVASVVYEDFDEDTYSKDDLQKYLEDAVSAYNQQVKGENRAYLDEDNKEDVLPVYIDEFTVKNNRATFKLEYTDCQTYVDFNAEEKAVTTLVCAPVAQAADVGIDLASITGQEDEEQVCFSSYAGESNNWVVAVQGNTAIQLEGKVKAQTSNVTVVDNRDVTVDTGENETAYIIFRR
jgi:uncharacterized protein YxeA